MRKMSPRTIVLTVLGAAGIVAAAVAYAGKSCTPKPDTPTSVITYFQKMGKPLPEQFCAGEKESSSNAPEPAPGAVPTAPQENAEGPLPPPEDSDPVQLEAPRNYHWNFPRQRGSVELDEHHIELNFPRFHLRMEF